MKITHLFLLRSTPVKHRSSMCLNLLACIGGGGGTYQPTLLDAIHMTTQSWEKVTTDTIAHCFCKAGFRHSSDDQTTSDSEPCLKKDLQEVEPILSRMFKEWNIPPSDYFTVDEEVLTEDPTAAPDVAAEPCTSRIPDSDASSEEEDEEMP
ncbi:hypothetical protein ACOMHN_050375 [Nucella lapillus]